MADAFTFEELGVGEKFVSPELQKVASGYPATPRWKNLRVCRDGVEVAYLSFDLTRDGENNLYHLYVAKDFRKQGIATKCIEFAAEFTRQLGRSRLVVWPRPFGEKREADPKRRKKEQKELEQWYIKRGFTPMKSKEFKPMPGMPRMHVMQIS